MTNLINSGGLDATIVVLKVNILLVFITGPECLRFLTLKNTKVKFVIIFLTTRDCHLRHLTV